VIRIQLSPDGESVRAVKTLLSHHHNALHEPTTLAIADNGFYLLAATAVRAYGADGTIANPDSVPRPAILRIPF
jgi:hypothetical protein